MEQGMVSYSDVVSHQPGVATARNTYAAERDPIIPQSSCPFQRTAVVLVPEREKYARTSGRHSGVEEGKSIGAVGIVAVFDQDTPVAVVQGKKIAAVSIPVEAEGKGTAGAGTPGKSTAAGRNLGEIVEILMGRPARQDKSKSAETFVRAGEVSCNYQGLGMEYKAVGVARVA